MNEDQDPKPHPVVASTPPQAKEQLSIWFFCGILTLSYGVVLLAQGVYEHFGHQPNTILANLEPTFWWGVVLTLFGLFFTIKDRPGKH
jgi:hypothetical protein